MKASQYVTGFCGTGQHEVCRLRWAGPCACPCRHAAPAAISEGPRIGSLCSGAGMLDVAMMDVLGGSVAWHCEYEPPTERSPRPAQAAAKVLAYRRPGVPNHGDLTAVDWTTVEPVDIVTAGWPCQPWSAAGKNLGAQDVRAIWPDVARAIRFFRPGLVYLENVPDVATHGELRRVVTSLASIGYVGSWTCVRADEVGAPHERDRLFIVASPADAEDDGRERIGAPRYGWAGSADGGGLGAVADANGAGREGSQPAARRHLPDGGADRWAASASARERWAQLTRPAPDPLELGQAGNRRLNARFSEWMMGWPAGWVTDVPGLSRSGQLQVIGAGVVPQAASAALRWLLAGLAVECAA